MAEGAGPGWRQLLSAGPGLHFEVFAEAPFGLCWCPAEASGAEAGDGVAAGLALTPGAGGGGWGLERGGGGWMPGFCGEKVHSCRRRHWARPPPPPLLLLQPPTFLLRPLPEEALLK